MKVILKRSCLVQPAEPTWNGRMPLSESDQIGFVTHVPGIYFYKLNSQTLPKKDTTTMFTTLKTSLSKVLMHFYPVAGRLTWLEGSRLELYCNGKGVRFIEASCIDATLDDVLDFKPSPDFKLLVPEINYRDDSIEEIPLFIAQVTKFTCGGFALSVNMSHALVDGQGSFHFFSEWARIARGKPIGTPPFLDRKVLRAGGCPPPLRSQPRFEHNLCAPRTQLIGQSSNSESSKSSTETTIAMLKLSKSQLDALRKEANHEIQATTRAYSLYESIAGHIWRCASKARRHAPEQPTSVGVCVNIRRRMQPPLPENYFGNAIEYVIVTGLSGDLLMRPLSYAVGKIRQAVDRVTSEYVHSSIDFLKNLEDLSGLQDIHAKRKEQHWVFYGNPNIGVISWMGLPIYGLDFGCGKEVFSTPVTSDGDGDSVIMQSYQGDGSLLVALCLESKYIEDFKKLFYQLHSNL